MKPHFFSILALICLFSGCQEDNEMLNFLSDPATDRSTVFTSNSGANIIESDLWTLSNPLITARSRQTATVLPTGMVLVAGGYTGFLNNFTSTDKCELYDPGTETWTMTSSMSFPRSSHTATRLPNGKILIAGGRNNNMATATVELYDAMTGTWTTSSPMNFPRFYHTATLLENGKVLVTGGLSSEGVSIGKTAEIYEPALGSWSLVDHMAINRWGHSATLLENGMVLVAGGSGPAGDGIYTPLAEIYDPIENVWRNVGRLNTPRGFHAAAKLQDGTVLIAGGLTILSQQNNVTSTAEIYNPENETWTPAASMTFVRIPGPSGSVLLPDGQFLVAGGRAITTETYESGTDAWTLRANLNVPRSFHTLTLLPNGSVLAVGGENRNGFISTVEIYNSPGLEFE